MKDSRGGSNPWFDAGLEGYQRELANGIRQGVPQRSLVTGLRFNAQSRRQRILEVIGTSPHWLGNTRVLWLVKKGIRHNLPPIEWDTGADGPTKGILAVKTLSVDYLSPFLRMIVDYEGRTVGEVRIKAAYAKKHRLLYAHAGQGSPYEYEAWLDRLREAVAERRRKFKLSEAPQQPKKWWQPKLGWQRPEADEWDD